MTQQLGTEGAVRLLGFSDVAQQLSNVDDLKNMNTRKDRQKGKKGVIPWEMRLGMESGKLLVKYA